ncbi:MAG: hypothetical protein Ct9H300mP1_15590 [Planctomycetaceae bacterium]|nr:MAG: hypothetical protein Ct9H300mP1_15590 [Planctomycetaceae bacterium]
MVLGGLLGMSAKFVECPLWPEVSRSPQRRPRDGGAMYISVGFGPEKKLGVLGTILAFSFAILCMGFVRRRKLFRSASRCGRSKRRFRS